MTDQELAQEVLDRVIRLIPIHTDPLRQLDPEDRGRREWQLGDYHFQVDRTVPRFFSLTEPFGVVRKVVVQLGIGFTNFNAAGYPFFMNLDLKEPDAKWVIQREPCEALLRFLRMEMVLNDLVSVRDSILTVEGSAST